MQLEDTHVVGSIKALPLNPAKKEAQACKSALAERFKRTCRCGFDTPMVRLIRQRRNARPGTTTTQAKLSSPMLTYNSLSVVDVRPSRF